MRIQCEQEFGRRRQAEHMRAKEQKGNVLFGATPSATLDPGHKTSVPGGISKRTPISISRRSVPAPPEITMELSSAPGPSAIAIPSATVDSAATLPSNLLDIDVPMPHFEEMPGLPGEEDAPPPPSSPAPPVPSELEPTGASRKGKEPARKKK